MEIMQSEHWDNFPCHLFHGRYFCRFLRKGRAKTHVIHNWEDYRYIWIKYFEFLKKWILYIKHNFPWFGIYDFLK